jgi:phosphoenolpyruvate carboxykinase (diphosphate)
MNMEKQLGFGSAVGYADGPDDRLVRMINLQLAALGRPAFHRSEDRELEEIAEPLLLNYRAASRAMEGYLCPADQRIQDFLVAYLGEDLPAGTAVVPGRTFVLHRHGMARTLSLPADGDSFESDIVTSYRVKQGVLHNPRSDRRTTQGVFHVAEGGLPVPCDKKAVPRRTFAALLQKALQPPVESLRLPYTANCEEKAELFVSLLLRPVVRPEVAGVSPEKTIEVRFFAPGSLVSNLDFVESIFGNAGDPYLPENDAGLDAAGWSGHTAGIILAPHLIRLTKREVGLPRWEDATERQRRDGMCWKQEDELYNDGGAFKVTCRDERGVMVTLIADNYFGYCKKEVKTQLSYAANLMGGAEEEHAGGALAFPSWDIAFKLSAPRRETGSRRLFSEVVERFGAMMDLQPEGYGVDKRYSDILYVPEGAEFSLTDQTVSWVTDGEPRQIRLSPKKNYVLPSGQKVHMEKPPGGRAWRIIRTAPEGTFCHKPCTVSGGGKSEISKAITDAILHGPVIVTNLKADFDQVEEIIQRDFLNRFRVEEARPGPSRPLLSNKRSLGSVIKLLTPSDLYTEAYNKWLRSIPNHIKELVLVVKRFYRPEWGSDWRSRFSVDYINGQPGHELKCEGRKLVSNYLRVGYETDGSWRVFGLRKDFHPAVKIQREDDISASTVIAADRLQHLAEGAVGASVKLLKNCEYRLFQRPDEAIHRGYDKTTERDFAQPGNFFSNYEPMPRAKAAELIDDAIGFDAFTQPMKDLIREVAATERPAFFVSSAHPRIFEGKPTKNPRYLQDRPDLQNLRELYLSEVGIRLYRRIPLDQPAHFPVDAVLPGRRNNPPDAATGIRPLCVYNPIHYQELPELFMDFIASLTGKSPSTTGAGSEGALTKGPFNALLPIVDLNSALVSYLLTEQDAFSTAAGYVGPKGRFDHDISLLVPEVWCRMTPEERRASYMIERGYLEKCEDFEYKGKPVLASRLGYRITEGFIGIFFGRIFNNPDVVFTPEMLRPELQSMEIFADGMDNIVSTQAAVAANYFLDGSIEQACPPLRALLHIMRDGHYQGKNVHHPEIRGLFTRESLLASDWYVERLRSQQRHDIESWSARVAYLERFANSHPDETRRLSVSQRLAYARSQLSEAREPQYLDSLRGGIGRDSFRPQRK